MPVPFQDIGAGDSPARIAYLRFVLEDDGVGIRGCLFLISGQGDPLEFSFTRVELPSGPLWSQAQAHRRAVAELANALFQAGRLQPDVVFCPWSETPEGVFSEDIDARIPVCRVRFSPDGDSPESGSRLPGSQAVSLCWANGLTADDPITGRLTPYLSDHHRLLEPFKRAGLGLEEAYFTR